MNFRNHPYGKVNRTSKRWQAFLGASSDCSSPYHFDRHVIKLRNVRLIILGGTDVGRHRVVETAAAERVADLTILESQFPP